MRPALRPGLLPLWRDRDTIQIGVDPRRAIALTGVGPAAALIGLLDGSRDRVQLVAAAAELGIPEPVTDRMLALLAAADALIDFPARVVQALPAELRRQLLPELAAASVARLDADGGAQVLARRAAAVVQVRGTGAVAASIAEVLTASGVATAVRPQPAVAGRTGASGGAAGPARTGRGGAAGDGGPVRPALVVLAGRQPLEAADQLRRDRVPHLAVSANEAIGTVGPLVRPGGTACLRCLDLTRADRDPAWPLILAQLATRQPDPQACDAALAAAVAAQAAAQALHFIDRPDAAGPAENATLELVQPGWQWRRRSWPRHPACTCRAAA